MSDPDTRVFFELFNEIGILSQLSGSTFEARLPAGMLVSHFSVLNHLTRVRDGQTPLALAQAFQVPKTTMTHTLTGLAKAGLVEMRPNPEDGRSKQVWLTAAGRAFREDAIAALGPDLAALAERFAPGRAAEILAHLTELRRIMDAMRDP
ncbi:MAG: MarR family transcriptional regulator [Pseudomonadota bacterium]